MPHFNYFTILAKDDKELIHSSFIRFLLTDDLLSDFIIKELFPQFNFKLNKDSIILEKVYTYKDKDEHGNKVGKRIRLDIEGASIDGSSLLIIENKFKSFPYDEQLRVYDERFIAEHGDKNIIKYLLCFDSSIIPFKRVGWNFISYNDLLSALKSILIEFQLDQDKKTFIVHYIQFLNGYFEKYEQIKNSCGHLFSNGRNDENKFWIRHVNAIARLKLEKYFADNQISVRFNVNPGNTSVPLLDIFPNHWNKLGHATVLIQVQDDNLKYYCHSKKHDELNPLIEMIEQELNYSSGKLNKRNPSRGNTNFIYQEKLGHSSANKPFNIDDFTNRIIAFYEKVDQVARKRFENTL